MKTNKLIPIIIILYVLCLIGAYFVVNHHIEQKDKRLGKEIVEDVNNIFGCSNTPPPDQRGECKGFIDILFSGGKVFYEQRPIPKQPSKDESELTVSENDNRAVYSNIDEHWNSYYRDIHQLYRLVSDNKDALEIYGVGWNIVLICNRGYKYNRIGELYAPTVCFQVFFPYAVGIKRLMYDWLYDYAPSVETAVEEAFDFFTTNPKSCFIDNDDNCFFERGSYNKIMNSLISIKTSIIGLKRVTKELF